MTDQVLEGERDSLIRSMEAVSTQAEAP
jgi:hypothetical protein